MTPRRLDPVTAAIFDRFRAILGAVPEYDTGPPGPGLRLTEDGSMYVAWSSGAAPGANTLLYDAGTGCAKEPNYDDVAAALRIRRKGLDGTCGVGL